MRYVFCALVVAAALLAVAGTTSAQGVDIYMAGGSSWHCTTAVDLNAVTVINPSADGVYLDAGCSGYIGSITVVQYHGDGIKIGSAANLEVGNINVHCYAHDAGKHQDGVQVMGGRNVRVDGGYVGCYSANDSQSMIHEGAGGQQLPTGVVFDSVTYDPAGVQDPTGQPPYTYGAGGAYGVSNGQSDQSGYTNMTLLSLANRHDLYQGAAATSPVWSYAYLCPGYRANF